MNVMCNGAGEMPGQEGRNPQLEDYNDWIDNNWEDILESYKEQLEFDDIPDSFLEQMYENTRE